MSGAHPGEVTEELLRECESEPIHTPGAVQAHGMLLLVDDACTVRAAANLELFEGRTEDALGRRLDEVVPTELVAALDAVAAGEPVTATLASGQARDAVAHQSEQGLLIEIEPPSRVDLDERTAIPRLLHRLQQATSIEALLDSVVGAVRDLTGFDRVMVYRFDPEWNGTVVAESVASGHGTFLGLRYPASDIPPQARALYLRNRVRLIPDVATPSVALVTEVPDEGLIDLSDVSLRAVSPVHVEYLRNMGVAASASVALTVGGELWGLIACHHYGGARRPSQRVRSALDVVCGTASALLAALLTTADALERIGLTEQLDRLSAPLFDEDINDPLDALDADAVLDLLGADGLLVTSRRSVTVRAGLALVDEDLDELQAWLTSEVGDQVTSDHVDGEVPVPLRPADPHESVAGLLALRWGGEGDWLVALRREQVRSIRWGGNPTDKEVVLEPDGARLGPRRSFEEYVETVRGRSTPWAAAQRVAAAELARRIAEAFAARARRDRSVAALMQRALLLDTVPSVPGADVAVSYRPAKGDSLGGDWFDVYFRPDGRAVIALGDVAGHGMGVASTMAQIRHALRAYVVAEDDLSHSMVRLNELCCNLLPRDMATLVVALFDAPTGTLEVINAGHLPPVVARAGGATAQPELARNPALGISRDATFTASSIVLDHGDQLVLCTDGLIERRTVLIDEQLDQLAELLGTLETSTSREVCDVLDANFEPDGSDDVTVLVLRYP